MIGRENFSVSSCHVASNDFILQFRLENTSRQNHLPVYAQAIFGERVLHSLSFPTGRSLQPCLSSGREMAGDVKGLILLSFMTNACDAITYVV